MLVVFGLFCQDASDISHSAILSPCKNGEMQNGETKQQHSELHVPYQK